MAPLEKLCTARKNYFNGIYFRVLQIFPDFIFIKLQNQESTWKKYNQFWKLPWQFIFKENGIFIKYRSVSKVESQSSNSINRAKYRNWSKLTERLRDQGKGFLTSSCLPTVFQNLTSKWSKYAHFKGLFLFPSQPKIAKFYFTKVRYFRDVFEPWFANLF